MQERYNSNMAKFSGITSILSLILLLIAFSKRNTFSDDINLHATNIQEPLQIAIDQPAFTTVFNEETFEVIPKYDYELNGIVVSYRLHDSENGQMLHALTKDHLNVADFCVVWGDAANPELLREFKFSNAQFTCRYSSHNQQAWQSFNHNQLSNNHLLATDSTVRTIISDVKIGDQINIKGWLSHYKGPIGGFRGTSIVRTDTGNGACETIFVNDIQIIKSMDNFWRALLTFSIGSLLISLFIYFKSPYEPYR